MRRPIRAMAGLASAALLGIAVGGCQFTGFAASSLPFTAGTGSGSYTVTAQVADVNNLAPNSEVMVNDVHVGTVTAIKWDDWHADLTISLPDTVKLPANATASVGQTSLLGAEYVALAPPSGPTKPQGELAQGDVIPLVRTGAYPSTEDVLAAMSTFLNGGGLNQLSTVTRELNATLDGHTEQVRDLLTNLTVLVGTLNSQKQSIVGTLGSVNSLAAKVRTQNQTLTRAIDGIPSGLAVLNKDEGNLTQTLSALSNLSTTADRVINTNSANLLGNLRDLQPTLQQLTASEHNLVRSLSALGTFPFPVPMTLNMDRGDYSNVNLILNLSTSTLEQAWLTGLPGTGATAAKPSNPSKPYNPLTGPLQILGGGKSSPGTGSGGSGGSSTSGSGGIGGLLGGILGGGNG